MREPDAGLIMTLTRGQFYSVPMIVVGITLVAWSLREPVRLIRHQRRRTGRRDALRARVRTRAWDEIRVTDGDEEVVEQQY